MHNRFMPIKVRCQCGQILNVKDEAAGKQVKCIQCESIVAIPRSEDPTHPVSSKTSTGIITVDCSCGKKFSVSQKAVGKRIKCPECGDLTPIPRLSGGKASSATVSSISASTADSGSLNDLLDDVGLPESVVVENPCPHCRVEMPTDTVVCVNCGYSHVLGRQIKTKREITSDEDLSAPESLRKAMRAVRHEKTDRRAEDTGPMTSWILGLILFAMTALLIGGGLFFTQPVATSNQAVVTSDFVDSGDTVLTLIIKAVLSAVVGFVVSLLITSAVLCVAVAIVDKMIGDIPQLGFGKSLVINVVTLVVSGLILALGSVISYYLSIFTFPVELLVMSAMVSWMLPTSFGRAALVVLCWFLIFIVIFVAIAIVLFVIVMSLSLSLF